MATQWQISEPGRFEGSAGSSRVEEIISLYAALAEADCADQSAPWDRLLGLATIVSVSACGWMAIIALARLLW
jgi:hypothetical protein